MPVLYVTEPEPVARPDVTCIVEWSCDGLTLQLGPSQSDEGNVEKIANSLCVV